MNKYKAKRLDNNEWIEGFYAIKGEETDLEQHVICVSELDVNSSVTRFYLVDIEVDPKTVSQATGLKDKYEKMIFEGDNFDVICESIINRKDKYTTVLGTVKRAESGMWFVCFVNPEAKESASMPLIYFLKSEKQIIGNIHDK